MERNAIATPLKGGGKKWSENNLGRSLELVVVTNKQTGIKKRTVCYKKLKAKKKMEAHSITDLLELGVGRPKPGNTTTRG